jgi:hypothetical protein
MHYKIFFIIIRFRAEIHYGCGGREKEEQWQLTHEHLKSYPLSVGR